MPATTPSARAACSRRRPDRGRCARRKCWPPDQRNIRGQSAPDATSTTLVSWIGLPVSRVSSSASSALRARSIAAARCSTRPRSVPLIAAQPRCALRARATAASTSAAPSILISASTAPVAGLIVTKRSARPARFGEDGGVSAAADLISAARSRSRPSTNAVSSARADSLSASAQFDSAARSHTPSIIAAIIAARLRASSPGNSRRNACRRFDSMRRWYAVCTRISRSTCSSCPQNASQALLLRWLNSCGARLASITAWIRPRGVRARRSRARTPSPTAALRAPECRLRAGRPCRRSSGRSGRPRSPAAGLDICASVLPTKPSSARQSIATSMSCCRRSSSRCSRTSPRRGRGPRPPALA